MNFKSNSQPLGHLLLRGQISNSQNYCQNNSEPLSNDRSEFLIEVTTDYNIKTQVYDDCIEVIPCSPTGPAGHRNKILRTIKDIKKEELEEDIPDEFLCPITRDIMSDPVIAAGWLILLGYCSMFFFHVLCF